MGAAQNALGKLKELVRQYFELDRPITNTPESSLPPSGRADWMDTPLTETASLPPEYRASLDQRLRSMRDFHNDAGGDYSQLAPHELKLYNDLSDEIGQNNVDSFIKTGQVPEALPISYHTARTSGWDERTPDDYDPQAERQYDDPREESRPMDDVDAGQMAYHRTRIAERRKEGPAEGLAYHPETPNAQGVTQGDGPQVYYHGTAKDFLDNILSQGLQSAQALGRASNQFMMDDDRLNQAIAANRDKFAAAGIDLTPALMHERQDSVYMAPDQDTVTRYAYDSAKRAGINDVAMVEITVPEGIQVKGDEFWKGAYRVQGSVPPSWITGYKVGRIHPNGVFWTDGFVPTGADALPVGKAAGRKFYTSVVLKGN